MIISTLKSIPALPTPALGLLPAIHDAEVEDAPFTEGDSPVLNLPPVAEAKGRVFRNQSNRDIVLPAAASWPARNLAPGKLFGSDGRLFYEVRNKQGTTSYYPESFERSIYNFTFSKNTFGVGDIFDWNRFFYFRLIGNNTTAVWSVIVEVGMRYDQASPTISYTIPAVLTSGSAEVQVSDPRIGSLIYRMQVSGDGIPSGLSGTTYISDINAALGKVTLSQAATSSGTKQITFSAPVGPNLEGYRWLTPLLEEQVTLTEIKTICPIGIWLKNWGSKSQTLPDGTTIDDPNRNESGYEGYAKLYSRAFSAPPASLPTDSDFIIRVRIGQFDTENNIPAPKGYAAYLVLKEEEDDGLAGNENG